MHIPIDTTGDIVNSPRPEHQVRVVDDAENTDGYLVCEWWLESDGPNPNGAFDSWLGRRCEALERMSLHESHLP